MFFKKKKIKSQSTTPKKTVYILGVLGAVSICMLGYFVVSAMENMDFNVFEFSTGSGSISFPTQGDSGVSQDTSDVNGEEENITYILLTGRGGGNHDAPDLTDTIILAGINKQHETITLFSIPRDLYVEYPGSSKKGKINRIYETFLPQSSDFGMQKLKTKITQVTGKEIDYYMNIDFNGFKEVVNALGGVEISLEQNFVDYEFPDENLGYRPFILKKGTWTLDGDVALMYARSRHSSSDFDRSLRQQQIISSLREKVGKLGYFKDRKTILELYNIFSDYVETDMSITQMVSLGLNLRSWDSTKTLSFNLNDSCYSGSPSCVSGGLLYVPLREYFGGASVLLPNNATYTYLSKYEEFQDFSTLIFEHSDIYQDPKNIFVYNNTSTPLYAASLVDTLAPYGFSVDRIHRTASLKEKKFEKSILYYNGIEKDDSTLAALSKYIDIEMQQVDAPLYSDENTRIEIILADDDSF